ncbi:3-hydroxyacyl-CoA dehydrogenase family protein [Rubrobacter aplysinae]|uniref:3-hydroxyacyl-CoA dehydrogenase family protein n=1 Tax=Rubrobacter aplysinae TaxID=909625 RepID=UPI00064BE2DC|nr:3-hydroxyacyl-CoA dehydrogenase NAD-binding domain-containing protein [Rubrobacter aplysinae]
MEVEKIAVVGAGTMGEGIAQSAAVGGFSVGLREVDEERLRAAEESIGSRLDREVEKGRLSREEAEAALGRLSYHAGLSGCVEGAGLVVEAVPEVMELKLEVFGDLDRLCAPETVLATNTSTMSPTEIGASTGRADRCIAMHFFNPVPRMKLVEIVRGLDTSDDTYETARLVAERMGKETVEVEEFPGFVTSRMSCLIGNEAMNMLQEGVASAGDIDRAIKLGLNHPMGPLELADLVGLDARLRNTEYLHAALGERFRPSPLLVKYVKAGRLGRKTGRGFYDYGDGS